MIINKSKRDYNKRELASVKPADFKELSINTVYVCDKHGAGIYEIHLDGFNTSVFNAKTMEVLNCTPGTRGGWPYYIADFIYRR